MDLNQFIKNWKKFVDKMNEKGIPAPTIRDPKTGEGSVSLTLVFVSSLLVIGGIVGKWSHMLGEINLSYALEFFYASSALYFGRKWQSIPKKNSETPDSPDAPTA